MARRTVEEPDPGTDRNWDGSPTTTTSTYWIRTSNTAHYKNADVHGTDLQGLLQKLPGRVLAVGDVADWVKVPSDNEARYGSNEIAGERRPTGVAVHRRQRLTRGMPTRSRSRDQGPDPRHLSQFDKVDRYDYDGDGNFNEPDGYIDHFQDIHAGEGEEAGGGAQGEDAI